MPDAPPLLPELARSLRSLGAARDDASEAAHDAVFGPLLEARGRAGEGDARHALEALHGEWIGGAIVRDVTRVASAGAADDARGRARAARARDAVEPLLAALRVMDERAEQLSSGAVNAGSLAWADWIGALRHAFEVADVACTALAVVLRESDPPAPRRWRSPRAR